MAAFGGYSISFKAVADKKVSDIFGTKPIAPSQMTKKIWEFVKKHNLSSSGSSGASSSTYKVGATATAPDGAKGKVAKVDGKWIRLEFKNDADWTEWYTEKDIKKNKIKIGK